MATLARPCHAAAGRHQADTSKWEVADIMRLYGQTYRAAHPVPPPHHKVIHDLMTCRTAELGGHAEQCGQCGFERYASNSCRNRHCPTCQTLRKEKWREDRQADLLAVPSFHCVFTLPHDLNPLVLTNKRALLTLLCRATSQTLLQFGHHNLGGQPGGILLLHTWEQTLNAHFHVHALAPGDALADKGTRWVSTHPRFLFPVHALSTVFRSKFLDALHDSRNTVMLAEQTAPLASAQGFRQFLARLYDHAWVVYAKRPMAGPQQGLDYLGRYTHRVAIANHRIVEVQDAQVRLTCRNRRQGHRVEIMSLPAHEFIRRFLVHGVPHGFQRLRPIGFLANRCKVKALRQGRPQRNQPEPARPQKKTLTEWRWQLTGTDVTRCPQCGHRPLPRIPLGSLTLRAGTPVPPPVLDSS